jgi:hypothetical protein
MHIWGIITKPRYAGIEAEEVALTFVKFGNRRLALQVELLFSMLLECVVSLGVVPRIELKDIVLIRQNPVSELERIVLLLVRLWIVGSVGK